MHHNFYQTPLGTVLTGLANTAMQFRQLTHNPGLTEAVQREFQDIANSLSAMLNTASDVERSEAVTGNGPVSRAVRVMHGLNPINGVDTNNLCVRARWWTEEEMIGYDPTVTRAQLFKTFNHPVLQEQFAAGNVVSRVVEWRGLVINVTLTKSPSKVREHFHMLDEIRVNVSTSEKFWEISHTVKREDALYSSNSMCHHGAMIQHLVEGVGFSGYPLPQFDRLLLDVVYPEILTALGFERPLVLEEDTDYVSPKSVSVVPVIMMVLETLEIEEELHPDFFDYLIHCIGYRKEQTKNIQVPWLHGLFSIKTGHSAWGSYTRYLVDTYYKDKYPLFELTDFSVFGVPLAHKSIIPRKWIDEHVLPTVSETIAAIATPWLAARRDAQAKQALQSKEE